MLLGIDLVYVTFTLSIDIHRWKRFKIEFWHFEPLLCRVQDIVIAHPKSGLADLETSCPFFTDGNLIDVNVLLTKAKTGKSGIILYKQVHLFK